MQHILRLTLLQTELHWENTAANLAHFEELIWQIEEPTDVIVLPEMFTTGFSMEAEKLAEPMNLTTTKWMKQMASQTKAAVTGSFIVNEDGHYYNRLLWVYPNGEATQYDKRHLFSFAGENQQFTAGTERVVMDFKGWKICPLICYDLRFPVWSRNTAHGYDLLLYVANWPKARVAAWNTLLPARAIENAAYCIGLNRIGKDGNGVEYNGQSGAYGPKGNILLRPSDKEAILAVKLSKEKLEAYRGKFPVLDDAENFKLL